MRFGSEHTALLDEALYMAEHSCADHFKMGGEVWKRLRFELGTSASLRPGEVFFPDALARLVRYEATALLPSAVRHFYRICLQDGLILRVACRDGLDLLGLLTYVLTHELVHVIRFSRFEQLFHAAAGERIHEERRVHELTHEVLRPFRGASGLATVLSCFETTRPGSGLCFCC
ncbi:MAG: hypothetical protein V2A77_09505 [Pseudomonadota bacterium]